MVDKCSMKDTKGCFVIVKVHIPSWILFGATRTVINESGPKYILVTKRYDERETYDVSHAVTFSKQRFASLPWEPCVNQLTTLSNGN